MKITYRIIAYVVFCFRFIQKVMESDKDCILQLTNVMSTSFITAVLIDDLVLIVIEFDAAAR